MYLNQYLELVATHAHYTHARVGFAQGVVEKLCALVFVQKVYLSARVSRMFLGVCVTECVC